MKIIVQRVKKAQVEVENIVINRISQGLLLFVGIGKNDSSSDVKKMAQKIANLRIFADRTQKMNLTLNQINGQILVIPQFTLFGELKGQNRPFFGEAAAPEVAQPLFNDFVTEIRKQGLTCFTGKFGAYMAVELVNDGPVTVTIDSHDF